MYSLYVVCAPPGYIPPSQASEQNLEVTATPFSGRTLTLCTASENVVIRQFRFLFQGRQCSVFGERMNVRQFSIPLLVGPGYQYAHTWCPTFLDRLPATIYLSEPVTTREDLGPMRSNSASVYDALNFEANLSPC